GRHSPALFRGLRDRGARRDPQFDGIGVAEVDRLDARTLAKGAFDSLDAIDAGGAGTRRVDDRRLRPDVRRGLALAQRGGDDVLDRGRVRTQRLLQPGAEFAGRGN